MQNFSSPPLNYGITPFLTFWHKTCFLRSDIKEWLFSIYVSFDQSVPLSEEIRINLNTFYEIVHEIEKRALKYY